MYGSRSTSAEVEVVALGVLGVDEDRVVLGGPALLRARAVVVGPADLVEEVLAAEDLVEKELAVVSLAIVDVEVERSRCGKDAPTLDQARLQEGEANSSSL
jgi:hypothetical protein